MQKAYGLSARAFLSFAAVLLAAIFLSASMIGKADAAILADVATSLTTFNQTIKASSTPTAVIGINLVSNSETFASTSVAFLGSAGFATTTDFAALGTATSSGVAIYRDDPTAGTQGSFDAFDDVVPLQSAVWGGATGATTTLSFLANETVPTNDTDANTIGNDYFIVIQTAGGAVDTHAFTANIYPGGLQWNASTPSATPLVVSTNTVTIDTAAPTLSVNTTGPANGSTGVPVSTFIHLGFSENLDQTTLNPNNVTMTTGGNAVGVALRPFPNGFDLIVSSPPTYTASSRFAKATTVSTGFFQISGTSQIFPQGAYTAPARGDIVYTQLDTFPPEVGVVTNATLTSGTFAINNNPAFRPLQITKFAAPTASGYTTGGAVVGVGDLLVANTSAKPTSVRYDWHIVTTAQALNDSGLRLDDQDAAPTYATTTFARLMPTATSTINTSQQLVATTTFAAGDLVFAKVVKGADNLNSYAWHLVTSAEAPINGVLGTGPTAGTSTTLRLDNAATAPTFAADSVVAKLTSSAQGALDGAVAEDATVFGFGDIMFAKASANAANTGAYAFHIVSNGATGATSTALRLDNSASNLTSSATYVINAKPGITDTAGNALAATSTITFTTGATGGTNTTPPMVQNSQPQAGNQSFAPNAPIKLTFSVAMEAASAEGANSVTNPAVVTISTSVNGTPTTQVPSVTNTYDSTTQTVTLTPASSLALSTEYVVQVKTTAKSSTGASFPSEYRLYFRTASAIDETAPTIQGVSPSNTSTGVSMSPVITAGFSKDMNPATLTTTTVTLVKTSDNSSVAGGVSYSPNSRSVSFVPTTPLLANTGYSFVVVGLASGVKDLANNALAAHSTTTFTTTATADTAPPSVSFANADDFGIAITFSEPMKTGGGPNAADNIANYTLESPTGTTISLGGKSVTYDAGSKTARITGLALQNGNQYKVTVAAPVHDAAGNGISTSGTPAGNLAYGTIQNSTATGGQLGPGGGTMNFSMQGMNPTRVSPEARAAGVTSNYKVEFLASSAIPAGGQIQLVFPSGFTITSASTTAAATSFCNADINGPMPGVPSIASVSNDNASGIMTITTAASSTGASAFVCLDITGVVNSSIPNSSGYTVDIKTRDTAANNRAILETKTSSPFFLGVAGSRTLTVNVFNDGNANETINANEGIANVRVFLFSPASGGNSTTTIASGVATFNSLADGDYMIGIDPGSLASASSTVTFNSFPQPFTVSATSLTKNFIVSGGGNSVTISGEVTGPSGTSVDVFASSNNGFSRKTITLTAGPDEYSIPVSTNTVYNVGVGPAMPDAHFTPGAPPPPPPTFTFMPPPNISVSVGTTSVTGRNFTLTTASKTITGTVLDSTGAAVSNAGVFARPLANSTIGGTEVGFGTGGMTNTSGAFTLNVVPGTYLVGVFKGGMPNVPDQPITVPATGANTPLSLAFSLGAGTSLTISGTIKDDGGNAIPYAGVNARKVVSTSDTTPMGGGTGNFIGGPTDANGAYTLYVDAGTWVVEAFAPGFGKLGQKTLTVTTSSLSGQDFSAQTLSLGTITGTTTKASVLQQGVMVRAEGSAGANMGVSDANGVYTLKVPAGSYTVTCFFPGVGESTPLTGVTVTADQTTYNNNCTVATPITITVNLTDGTNPITGAYIDVRGSTGRGNGTNVSSNSGANAVYTVVVPPGTYTVRAGHPAYGTIGSTAGVAETQAITYTTSAGALNTVSGTVTAGGTAVNGAWVTITGTPTGQTNIINRGGQTNSLGAFSIQVPSGSYQIRADKPGYIGSAATALTVSGTTAAGALTLTAASQTISGTVRLNDAGVSGAFVDAQETGGGFAVAQTDSAGAYTLAVKDGTWTIRAHSMGYEGGPNTVTVAGNSPTGQVITLSAISGFTMKPERQETVTPTSGGLFTNSDIGDSFKLNIPANALGTGSNAGTVKSQVNTAVPRYVSGTVLSKSAVSISAVDSSGQPIKTLNDDVTIVVPYVEADLPAGAVETDLQLGVWNDATLSYDVLSTTVDTANNTLTAVVSHFSDFAPLVSSAVPAAAAAATPAATVSGGGGGVVGGGGATNIPKGRAQIIYPDGRIVYLDQMSGESAPAASAPAGASSAASASASASVSSKFIALLKQGSRGTDVKRLQKLLGVEETGFFGVLTRAAVEQFQIKNGIAKKGEAGFGTLGPKTRAKIGEVFGAPAAPGAAQAGTMAILAGGKFVRALNVRATGSDVRTLQQILNSDPDTTVMATGAGSSGNETTYFGPATLKAVKKFQEKHGIAALGIAGYGNVGPKTRAKLNELLTALRAVPATPATPATPGGVSSPSGGSGPGPGSGDSSGTTSTTTPTSGVGAPTESVGAETAATTTTATGAVATTTTTTAATSTTVY